MTEENKKQVIVVDDSKEKQQLEYLRTLSSIEQGFKIEQAYYIYEDIKYSHLTKKEREVNIVPVRTKPKIGRNELCPCGSKKKYKNCCIK